MVPFVPHIYVLKINFLNGHAADLVAEFPVKDLMVLSSAEHLASVLNGHRIRTSGDTVLAKDGATLWALTTSGSSETDVGVTLLVKHATIAVVIVACATLTERDGCLQHGALHVINKDGEVASLVVGESAAVACVGCRVLVWRVGVLAVTTGGDIGGVESTTKLDIGTVVRAVELLARVNELGPIFDHDGVVLTIRKVGDGRCGREVLVESVVGLHHTVGGEDGDVIVIVAHELGGIDPPAADTLLGVVELEVIPCVELDSEDLGDGRITALEGAHARGTATAILGVGVGTESSHGASVGESTVIVVVTSVLLVGVDDGATVASPVVAPP